MSAKGKPGKGGNGGNGGSLERRSGVDRRIIDTPDYTGPERRIGPRRKPARLPDKPIKR
ncbi:MAG TPA: hypothetical protein VGK94_08520 [Candidatus Polarisedimenticolia bacterium]|jgi:hypothetical protein